MSYGIINNEYVNNLFNYKKCRLKIHYAWIYKFDTTEHTVVVIDGFKNPTMFNTLKQLRIISRNSDPIFYELGLITLRYKYPSVYKEIVELAKNPRLTGVYVSTKKTSNNKVIVIGPLGNWYIDTINNINLKYVFDADEQEITAKSLKDKMRNSSGVWNKVKLKTDYINRTMTRCLYIPNGYRNAEYQIHGINILVNSLPSKYGDFIVLTKDINSSSIEIDVVPAFQFKELYDNRGFEKYLPNDNIKIQRPDNLGIKPIGIFNKSTLQDNIKNEFSIKKSDNSNNIKVISRSLHLYTYKNLLANNIPINYKYLGFAIRVKLNSLDRIKNKSEIIIEEYLRNLRGITININESTRETEFDTPNIDNTVVINTINKNNEDAKVKDNCKLSYESFGENAEAFLDSIIKRYRDNH